MGFRDSARRLKHRLQEFRNALSAFARRVQTRIRLLVGRIRTFVSSTEFTKSASSKFERNGWSRHANGRTLTFWMTTLSFSALIAAYSAMNGFTPIECVLGIRPLGESGFDKGQLVCCYVLIAACGSAAFNFFAARKNAVSGYTIGQYCWSIACGMGMITLSQALFSGMEKVMLP